MLAKRIRLHCPSFDIIRPQRARPYSFVAFEINEKVPVGSCISNCGRDSLSMQPTKPARDGRFLGERCSVGRTCRWQRGDRGIPRAALSSTGLGAFLGRSAWSKEKFRHSLSSQERNWAHLQFRTAFELEFLAFLA